MVASAAGLDIAPIAALIGERARAAMLTRLMAGQALTATELARAALVTKQTASGHLARLVAARVLAVESQGRHRYFRLAHPDVAAALERLMGVADRIGGARIQPGPAEPALRKARVCYDHLAGELGVLIYDGLIEREALRRDSNGLAVTEQGESLFRAIGIDVTRLRRARRPLALPCLDWSVRRPHLAGALGAGLLEQCFARKWAYRQRGTRIVHFSTIGERELRRRFAS